MAITGVELQRLRSLAPELQRRVEWVIAVAAYFGADVAIVSGLRTQAEQDRLYAQGRTVPGPIVTWTRNSAHTSGTAVDFAFRVNRAVDWNVPAWWWDALATICGWAGLRRTALSHGDLGHYEYN